MSPHDPVPGAPAATPTPRPLPAKSAPVTAKPRVHVGRVLLGAVIGGILAAVAGKLLRHWTHGSILPVVFGSVLAGLVAVFIEKREEKKSR